jgi:hypothetical protein
LVPMQTASGPRQRSRERKRSACKSPEFSVRRYRSSDSVSVRHEDIALVAYRPDESRMLGIGSIFYAVA